jgi:Golgi apparatus protein 1
MRHLIVAIALAAAAGSVAADQHAGRDACRADAERLCQGVEPGKGRVAQCLKEKEAQVSSECKAHMDKMHEAMQARMQAFNEACKDDVERHCKGVEPGQGRMVGCLRKNETSLSDSCRQQLAKMDEQREHARARMHGMAEACKGDAKQHCAGVRSGGGRMARCLKDNEAKLSAPCKEALQSKQ